MYLFYSVKTDNYSGPHLQFQCPECEVLCQEAPTYETIERVKLFFLIPIFKLSNSYIHCAECDEKFTLTKSVLKIPRNSSADEVNEFLARGGGFSGTLTLIFAFMLCFVPIVGQSLSVGAFYLNRRGDTSKALSIIAMIISFGLLAVQLYALITGK